MSKKSLYTELKQKALLEYLITSPEGLVRCNNIVAPEYFDTNLQPVVRYIKDYIDKYKVIPTLNEIQSETGTKLNYIKDFTSKHDDAFLDEVERFCKHKACEIAIIKGSEFLTKEDYDAAYKGIKEAVTISLTKDLGTDYFLNPKERIEKLRERNNMVSTGWRDVDKKLYGGFNRGELQIFAGAPGTGKSLFLQNLAVNWVLQGINCIYITCELSEELVGIRMDAMFTDISSKEIWQRVDDVHTALKIKEKEGKIGKLQIKYMPAGTRPADIESYLKEFEIQTGIRVDAVLVDYMDLLHPNSKIDASNLFVKDKYVAEELRALAAEWKVLTATASQLNRTAITEGKQGFDMSMIAGGISKINTADNVMGIFTTFQMKEAGEYILEFLKTRSSSGVGSRIKLGWVPESLRIIDYYDDDSDVPHKDNKNTIKGVKSKTKTDMSSSLDRRREKKYNTDPKINQQMTEQFAEFRAATDGSPPDEETPNMSEIAKQKKETILGMRRQY